MEKRDDGWLSRYLIFLALRRALQREMGEGEGEKT